jgi:hypothetical protein
VAKFVCKTCGEDINNLDGGLIRAIERGTRPVRRGSFAFVHKGDCDTPQTGPGGRVPDWELPSMAADPSQVRFLIRDAFERTDTGEACLSDDTLLAVVRTLDPSYPIQALRAQVDSVRCPPRRPLT